MPVIEHLTALEILDSRGRPTVRCRCTLSTGHVAAASVPSGASTGAAEALELRDRDPKRYRGLGVRKAVSHIAGPILSALRGRELKDQRDLDQTLLALDGTPNKSVLGANAILPVSIAFARACALASNQPLYAHFATLLPAPLKTLPRLTINLFSGGKHAGGQVPIQDCLIVPHAPTIADGLAHAYAVYQAAADLCHKRYDMRPLRADEGGLAPPFNSIEEVFQTAVDAIAAAGLTPGRDVSLAIDVASTHFYEAGRYHLMNESLSSTEMIARVKQWATAFPIVSLEDALGEDDWAHWPALRRSLGGTCLTLGDDFLCTNPTRITRAIQANAANALLLKVNQIGTLTEAAESCRLAKSAGWLVTISARSGETEDDWLADLATGWSGDQIKIGSITQSERLAKYNRLLEIEEETKLPLVRWPR